MGSVTPCALCQAPSSEHWSGLEGVLLCLSELFLLPAVAPKAHPGKTGCVLSWGDLGFHGSRISEPCMWGTREGAKQ